MATAKHGIEYGIFTDEGLIEGGFWSRSDAEDALVEHQHLDDEVWVAPLCPEHEGEPAGYCEQCDTLGEG